jgi:hypothetical protein
VGVDSVGGSKASGEGTVVSSCEIDHGAQRSAVAMRRRNIPSTTGDRPTARNWPVLVHSHCTRAGQNE